MALTKITSRILDSSGVTILGTIATGVWAATDIAVLHGGTGASTAGAARTNLGLVIGTHVLAQRTFNDTNWDNAYADRLKWDGGTTGLTASTGRTSLGLGTVATTAASDYATAAQGTKADTAHGWGNHTGGGYVKTTTDQTIGGAKTFSSAATLNMAYTGGSTGMLNLVSTGSESGMVLKNSSGDGFKVGASGTSFFIYDEESNHQPLTILANSNVGIGNTSPDSKLQVGLGTSNAGSDVAMFGAANGGILSALSLVNTLGNAVAGQGVALDFHLNSVYSPTGRIALVSENTSVLSALAFYTYTGSLVEKMRITSGGEYSFGTPSGVTYGHGSNDGFHLRTGLELGFGNGNNNRPDFGINATGSGGGASLNIYCGEGSDDIDIQISPGAVMQFNSGGIKFGGTPSPAYHSGADTLDSYEVGTWTPTITSSGTNPTISYDDQTGTYVRIGRSVTVWCKLKVATSSGGTGNLNISGLPYTVHVDADECGGSIGLALGFSVNPTALQADGNSTTVLVFANTANVAITDLSFNYIRFNITYLV
jgi:hypothetical protein